MGSHADVLVVLEMLEVNESTVLDQIRHVWRERTIRDDDHHSVSAVLRGDFMYCDPCSCRKIDENSARSRVSATR